MKPFKPRRTNSGYTDLEVSTQRTPRTGSGMWTNNRFYQHAGDRNQGQDTNVKWTPGELNDGAKETCKNGATTYDAKIPTGTHTDAFAEPRGRQPSFDPTFRGILAAWSPEIISCAVGVLIFIAITIILRVFDGKEQPNLAIGLTINSCLQYLTSFAKLAFLVPVIEGLGQLKWLWFSSRPRALLDFQLYDEATRGGLGIFKLSFRLRGFLAEPSLCLATVLLVSGLFTSAITQQVVTFDTALVATSDSVALAPRASTFSRWTGSEFLLEPNDQLDMEQTMLTSAYLDPNTTIPYLPPNCSTADCTWKPYGTLGICASTIDITNSTSTSVQRLLASLANTTIANLPNLNLDLTRAFLAGGSILAAPSGAFPPSVTSTALVDVLFIYTPTAVDPSSVSLQSLRFVELILHGCTKTYQHTIKTGVLSTPEPATSAQISSKDNVTLNAAWNTQDFNLLPQVECKPGVGGRSVSLAPSEGTSPTEEFTVDLCTAYMASSLMNQYLASFIALREEDKVVSSVVGMTSSALGTALYGGFLGKVPGVEEQIGNLRGIGRNLADGLTNMLRQKGSTYTNSTGPAYGTAYRATTVVKVQWAWLALLASQLALAILFLVSTMIATKNRSVQVLKNSSVAALCILDEKVKNQLGDVSDLPGLSQRAGTVNVRLRGVEKLELLQEEANLL
ncbi:hypothetical protein QBC47DRAFT_351261 [Echria macrotheca]|uniref:Uncharacterized protein n=1 Tax=Echria macrotheca TaxID=438768 RepID=A0AAJ0B8B0_9PEZI|nr:hypothetical protein QBC47DRAFT_351261 [Echria macrotheca]